MTIVGPDALGREGASVGRSLRGHAPDTEREEIPGFRFSVQASGMTRGLPTAGLKKGNGVGAGAQSLAENMVGVLLQLCHTSL